MQKTVFVASRNSVYGIFVANIARISTYALWGPNSGLSYLVRTPRKLCQAVFTYKSEKKYIHRWTKKYKSDKVGAAGPVLAHHHYKSSCQSKKYKFKFKYQSWILTWLHITIHTFLIIFVIAIYALSLFFLLRLKCKGEYKIHATLLSSRVKESFCMPRKLIISRKTAFVSVIQLYSANRSDVIWRGGIIMWEK